MKSNNVWRRAVLAAVILGSFWVNLPLQADSMSFRGRLIEQAPCTVNSGEDVNINFGEIQIREIDGQKYRRYINVPLVCDTQVAITLTQNGIPSDFNNAAVQTNITNFGVELSELHSNPVSATPLKIGVPVKIFNGDVSPKNILLSATPVKKAGAELATGVFNGVSTLQLEYP
ncbi:fimbrial protein [Serratia liquefaciens]|uniref:fimbrial protein n=1 Tax=Serratia liquefaciens TaxID=614 RepID=UPI00217936D9|nr:fimbrial protein [Serratia liquefaciens]CAI1194895.1 putative minor fimbrial subunit StfF [Serratia liquefaciens]